MPKWTYGIYHEYNNRIAHVWPIQSEWFVLFTLPSGRASLLSFKTRDEAYKQVESMYKEHYENE